VLENYKKFLTSDTVLVGHSLGAAFALHILQKVSIAACYLVAPAVNPLHNEFDEAMKDISHGPFNWDLIRKHCPHIVVVHSENDPYIPLANTEDLAKNLGTSVVVAKGAGHFNTQSGFSTFPMLLDLLKKSSLQ
jgi:predicted alpha/beta hydrolase family esterase